MARWYWNSTGLAETANGGRFAVEGLYDDSTPSLSHTDPRLLMRVGRPWTQKWPDVRHVALGVVVYAGTAAEAEERLLTLRGLVGVGSRGTLRHEFFSGRALEMQAECTKFDPATLAPYTYRVALEFRSVDEPFFRDVSAITTTATITATQSPYQVDFTHENPGLEDRGMVIRFHGPATNPLMWNLTADPDAGLWVGYHGTIADGDYVEYDVRRFTAKWKNGGAVAPDEIVHSGDRYWFVLMQGTNSLRFGADDSGGMVELIQNPPY